MRRITYILFALAFLLTVTFFPVAPESSAGELPKLITFTSYKVGALGYTISSGFREAIEQKTTMKARVEPYDTDVARVLPLKAGESELSILTGATGTCVSYGLAEFGTKEWGPQPLRQVWRGMSLYLSLIVRGDSGIKTAADVKGKRVPKVPGWPAGMLAIEGIMAFGNVGWDDVTPVPMSGYIGQLKGVIEGKVDVAFGATVTPTVKELQAGPHKASYVILPHADKAGWKRLNAVAPWMTPAVCKKAPGLAEGQTMEITGYPYSLWAYATVDPDVIYAVVKAMHEGFDIYKGMHRAMPAWNVKGAVRDPSPVPYHDGAIRYFKEVGVWTAEMDQWQAEQLKSFEERVAKFKQ
ncbi:MAG: TAXI family TRAP transporter solute-binding subunit [Deltaproteobacteria bacterium]|jgi:TRAP transporter TAXI family solute receptor|nr:TAXI family TRAP transporter solute-binding subunit [Deltaproteobacteria bacterium]